jgi:hypothetical protein
MALQTRTPLRRQFQRIHQRAEQRQVAEAHLEVRQPGGAQRLEGKRQDFFLARRAILDAQEFDASLEELGRTLRPVGLIAKGQAVVGNARGKRQVRIHRVFADWNGQVGAQAQFTPRQIGQGEGAAADFLAGTVEKNFRGLQHRRLFADIAARAEQFQDGDGLGVQRLDVGRVIIGKGNHISPASCGFRSPDRRV